MTQPESTPSTPTSSPAEPPATRYRRLSVAVLLGSAAYAGAAAALHVAAIQFGGEWEELGPERVVEVFWSMRIHGGSAIVFAAVALILRRRRACRRSAPRIALLSAVILLTVSMDRFAGILYAPPSPLESIYVPHPTRGWAYRPGFVGTDRHDYIEINSFGMRGPEFPRRKAAGESRIVFLGDSITFGFVPSAEATFVAQSGNLLRELFPESSIRCLNAGVTGYATWQEVDYLRNDGLALDPDLIVLNYCFNDVTDLVFLDPGKLCGRKLQFSFSSDSHWSGLVRAVRTIHGRRKWQATLDSLRWADDDWSERRGGERGHIEGIFREMPAPAVANAWQRALAYLEELETLCRSNDLPWVLVVFPTQSQLEQVDPAFHPQEKVERWATEHHIPCLDLLPAFLQEMAEHGRTAENLYMDQTHPSTEGNRLVAAELVPFLIEHKFVP